MRGAEWSLIIFTLLTQMAIGMFLVIVTVNTLYISKSDDLAGKEIVTKVLLAVIVILFLAIVASFLHIGKPKNAAYAISHFAKSWLSREIVFLVLFTLLAGISLAMQHLTGRVNHLLAVLACCIGIITILSMAKIYMLETVPAWNSFSTPVQFISASLLLGGIASIFLVFISGGGAESSGQTDEISKKLLPVLLFLMTVSLITFLIHLYNLRGAGIAGLESFHLLTKDHFVWLVFRISTLLVSIILACILLFLGSKEHATLLLLILSSIVLLSEIIGRYLFYAFYSRVGM